MLNPALFAPARRLPPEIAKSSDGQPLPRRIRLFRDGRLRVAVRRAVILALLIGIVLALAACASVPNPTGEMATARAAVDSARRAGAGSGAPVEMNDAQELLTRAERAYATKEYQQARRSAEQARVIAELAEEKSNLAKASQTKTELDNTLKALRNQTAPAPK